MNFATPSQIHKQNTTLPQLMSCRTAAIKTLIDFDKNGYVLRNIQSTDYSHPKIKAWTAFIKECFPKAILHPEYAKLPKPRITQL